MRSAFRASRAQGDRRGPVAGDVRRSPSAALRSPRLANLAALWLATGCLLHAAGERLWAESRPDSDPPETSVNLVQAALKAEVAGTATERAELLRRAVALDPTDAAARWQQGYVKAGQDWLSYEALVEQSKTSRNLDKYRELRSNSEPTLQSQLALAAFCRSHDLPEQERTHWTAVLELDPNHAEAHRRLGFVWQDGQWVKSEELAAGRRRAAQVADTFRKQRRELTSLRDGLMNGKVTVRQAAARLREQAAPAAIPGWEALLSTPTASGAQAVVQTLKDMREPEASASLIRHAVYSPWAMARSEAAEAIRGRDELTYVPVLLDALHSPWVASMFWMRAPGGPLICRYAALLDERDRQELHVLDQAFFITGSQVTGTANALAEARRFAQPFDDRRTSVNSDLGSHNRRVMELLEKLTGETPPPVNIGTSPTSTRGEKPAPTPQDWWRWWDDRNEVYSSGPKPLECTYAFRTATVYGAPLTPSRSQSGSGGSTKKDCLAAGTPILTERGPVAVERLRFGDLVLAQHPQTGEVALKAVLRTTIREPSPLVRISLGERTLRASGGHVFWVAGRGWIRARLLEPGMRLHGLGNGAEVTEVHVENQPVRSFNLVVADFHSYFVGQNLAVAVLSHDNSVRQPTPNLVPGLQP